MKKIREGYKMTELGEIPEEWTIKSLEEITKVITKGTTPTTYGYEFVNEGINFIKIESIDDTKGILLKDTFSKITEECHNKLTRSVLQEKDILFAIAGATVGKCALVSKEDIPANTNQALAVIRLKDEVENKFVFQVLRSNLIQSKIDNIKTNTAQPNLNLKQIGEFKIVIPTLEEQEKITLILSTVDEQIDNVDGLIRKNRELKKGLMQQLLTKGIGHTKFKNTEIGEIPEEWEVKRLDLIGEVVTGSTPKTSEKDNYGDEYLWVSPGDLGIKKYVTDTVKMLSHNGFSKTRKLPKGAILVTCIGSTIGKMGISRSELSTNQQINSIICNDKINSEFIYYALNYNFKMYTSFISTQAVPIINKTTFGELLIQIPSTQEQTKIALILSEIDEKIEGYENKKDKLEELKKGLMQQLLTGKIRVI